MLSGTLVVFVDVVDTMGLREVDNKVERLTAVC